MTIIWENVPRRRTRVYEYLDRSDPTSWGTDPISGMTSYTGRVIEQLVDSLEVTVTEAVYRTTMVVPTRPSTAVDGIGAGAAAFALRERGVFAPVPRRFARRTFPLGVRRPAGPRPRQGVVLGRSAQVVPEVASRETSSGSSTSDEDEGMASAPFYTPDLPPDGPV